MNILYLLSLPLGAFAYMSYMYFKFGDPLIYIKSQIPWGTKFSSIFTSWHNCANNPLFYTILFRSSIVLATLIGIYMIYKKVRPSYLAYLFVFIFFYFSMNTVQSTPRYISVLFPIFLGLSIYSEKSRLREYTVIIFSVMMLALMTILFVNGYWLT